MMNRILSLLVIFVVVTSSVSAQKISDKVLVTINNEEVKVSEFIEVYERNLNLVQDTEQKKLDNYLPLYISYRSKLIQAHELGLDTISEYKKELRGYREELKSPYFKDPKEEQVLLNEAWERSKYEIQVSHILILLKEDASSEDTLRVFNQLLEIKSKIEGKEISFADAAKKYSEGPSSKNSGELGWMTVFNMLYPFETGAYTTKVGDVSMPVRSSYGYHIIYVKDKRGSRGKVQVAHIYLSDVAGVKKDSVHNSNAKLMNTIYLDIQGGKEFAGMARRYSDDKQSGMNGGVLPVLGSGKLPPKMDSLAFSMNEGEFSQPFETAYGWHIVKVIKKYPISSFEDSKEELLSQLFKDDRSKYIDKSVVDHLYEKYSVEESTIPFMKRLFSNSSSPKLIFDKVENSIDSTYLLEGWKNNSIFEDEVVLTIEDKDIPVSDYISYLEGSPVGKDSVFSKSYILHNKRKSFIDKSLLDYYDDNLENEYPKFKEVMNNYREGILIYNLMNFKVWDKSYIDTVGLKTFYSNRKDKYMWPQRADLVIAKCFNAESANKAHRYLQQGKSQDYIKEKMNIGSRVSVTFQKGIVTPSNSALPKEFNWKEGVSEIYTESTTSFIIVSINKFIVPEKKTYIEAENKVRTDYQNYLENKWNEELQENFEVVIDKDVLVKLKKKYNQ